MINKRPFLYLVILFLGIALVAVFVQPFQVLAVEETPPSAGPPEQAVPTLTPTIPVPTVEKTPVETDPTEEVPTEEVPTEEVPTEEVPTEEVPTEVPPVEETPEVTPTSSPVIPGQYPTATQVAPAAEEVEAEPVCDETAEEAGESNDPYIDRADGRYRFLPVGGCAAYGGISVYCVESANPIQAAVDGAYNGETIHVEAGTYTEQVTVVNMVLTLQGHGTPTITAPAPLTATGVGYAVIYASNSTLNINGFLIDAGSATEGDDLTDSSIFGIYYSNSGGSITNTTVISNNTSTDNTYGIYVNNADGIAREIEISNNTITNYNDGGIFVEGDNLVSTISYNTVTNDDTPDTWSAAIRVDDSSGHTVSYNVIQGTNYQGLDIRDSNGNTITNNVIDDVIRNGISLVNSDGNTVTFNIITSADDEALSSGIEVNYDSDNNYITNNKLTSNSIGIAVLNNSDETYIHQNTITGSDTGIWVSADLGWDDPVDTTVYYNIITGNVVDVQNDTATSLVATYNWWGCAGGAADCAVVLGDVDVTNPLTTNPDPDGDLVFTPWDNCPFVYNPSQLDSDLDGIGDACEEAPVTEYEYKVYYTEDEDELLPYSAVLSNYLPSSFLLVNLEDDDTETEMAKVTYSLDTAPGGTRVVFEQELESTLPKPLEDDLDFLGPVFTLSAYDEDGDVLNEFDENMDIVWMLEEGYEAPTGYELAVYYFDTDTDYWISEEWQQVDVDLEDSEAIVEEAILGTYVLVLKPID